MITKKYSLLEIEEIGSNDVFEWLTKSYNHKRTNKDKKQFPTMELAERIYNKAKNICDALNPLFEQFPQLALTPVGFNKSPYEKHWTKGNNVRDLKTLVMKLWREDICAGFGIIGGWVAPGKNLVVVDIDNKNKEFQDMVMSALLKDGGKTFIVNTPGLGKHGYFWTNYPVRNSINWKGTKIDIKSQGGQVVAPGSMLKKGMYRTDSEASNFSLEVAQLPDDWMSILDSFSIQKKEDISDCHISQTSPTKEYKKKKILVTVTSGLIPIGSRNGNIVHCASKAVHSVANKEELFDRLRYYADNKCEAPETIDDKEIMAIAKWSYNRQYGGCVRKQTENKNRLVTSTLFTEELENKFFSTLSKTENRCGSLLEIRKMYREYLEKETKVEFRADMKLSLLGNLLRKYGFDKKHTRDGNYWNFEITEDTRKLIKSLVELQQEYINNCAKEQTENMNELQKIFSKLQKESNKTPLEPTERLTEVAAPLPSPPIQSAPVQPSKVSNETLANIGKITDSQLQRAMFDLINGIL